MILNSVLNHYIFNLVKLELCSQMPHLCTVLSQNWPKEIFEWELGGRSEAAAIANNGYLQ